MDFEQATIKVVKESEFGALESAIERVFSADRVAKYFKALDGRGIRARSLDAILAANVIDLVAESKAGTARSLYESLPVSDQGQVREFYLSKVEEVDSVLRAKFHKLYQYS
jgi:light-regulated signal transduction histidine kinase (bacteriophytochrome)